MALQRWILGRPLRTKEVAHETVSPLGGLALLSLDALSSVAYGTEAILVVLVGAGPRALHLAVPVALGIASLLALLIFSYTQVIGAYPAGGGAYAVSKDNLGARTSLVAAASLLVDYTLTVAVSIAAAVAAFVSAFPAALPFAVPVALAMLGMLTLTNLRGVSDSVRALALPAFVFIVGLLAVMAVGLLRGSTPAVALPSSHLVGPFMPLSAFLVLRAFASGCSAVTGVEAIANGVPMFREPKARNAQVTEVLLGALLAVMFVGVTVLSQRFHIVPHAGTTVLSQVVEGAFGHGWLFYVLTLATTVVLGLAANTSFNGLPILASLLARDHYAPHVLGVRGDRLVYSESIVMLGLLAAVLLVAFHGNTVSLIPLYAIGVFVGFTLSQVGLVRRWLRLRSRGFRWRAALNGVGGLATGLAALVFGVTKFVEGAWIVILAIPLIVFVLARIHVYYAQVGRELAVGRVPPTLDHRDTLVLVPLSGVDHLAYEALSYATSLNMRVVAVHVAFSEAEERSFRAAWEAWGPGVRLVVLVSAYRSVVRPILRFVDSLEVHDHGRLLVLVPELVARRGWQSLLHNQVGRLLSAALLDRRDVVVGSVPVHVAQGARRVGRPGHGGLPGSPLAATTDAADPPAVVRQLSRYVTRPFGLGRRTR